MNIWAPRLPGARVLDLFAGSGAVGIEAVSRGAISTCLVESDPKVLEQLHENCLLLSQEESIVVAMDLPTALARQPTVLRSEFELIFADPPYDFEDFEALATAVGPLLASGGEAVFEHSTRQELPNELAGWSRIDERRYGDTTLSFFALTGATQS